jgi:hypothetical protein
MMNQDDPREWERDKALGREELGDDAARLDALFGDNQREHIDELRGDLDLQVAIAKADCIVKLQRWFSGGTWEENRTRSGPLGDASAGVEWSYHGIHAVDNAFNGLRASNRAVTVRGFTIMGIDDDDGKFKIRRYIDWAGLFAQLGLTLNWRIPLTHPDDGDTADALA